MWKQTERKIALCGSEELVQSAFSTEAHRFCGRERHGDSQDNSSSFALAVIVSPKVGRKA